MMSSPLLVTVLWCVLSAAGTLFITRRYFCKGRPPIDDPAQPPAESAGFAATRRLEVSKKELELVFDAIPEQICIIDREYTVIRANRSYAEAVGERILAAGR